jgi:hypothetical protein
MDGSDLLAVDHRRQALVEGVSDRFFSLAKNRSRAFGWKPSQFGRVK